MERPALISGMRACGFKPPSTDLHAPTVTGPPEGVNRTRSASPLRSAPAFAPLKLAPLLDLLPATSAWGATPSMATALKLAPPVVVEVAGIEPASDMRCGDFIQS